MPRSRASSCSGPPSCGQLRVLVGSRAGEIVAAVRVGTGLARFNVAVLGSDEAGVGWCVGHPGCAACLHLSAEHRYDLGAEQPNLFERHVEWQPESVDVPQLSLVVAKTFLEGECLLDHFLRAANAHPRLLPVVLKRVRVAVDRGSLEVGAVRSDCILRALRHERVATKADDCLLRRTVPVM